MPRLVSPAGVTVDVSEEKAKVLGSGWRPADEPEPEKRTTKRSTKG